MSILLPRTYVLVLSWASEGNLAFAPIFKKQHEQGQINYAELAYLVEDLVRTHVSDLYESGDDPEAADISRRWNECAERCNCDLDESNDPDWHQAEAASQQWFSDQWNLKTIEAGFPDLAELRRAFPDAHEHLTMCGLASLEADAAVIPDRALYEPERFRFHLLPKQHLKVA